MNNMLLLPSVITEIGKCMIARFKREIDYLVHYKRNIENLRKEDEKLKALRDDVQKLVDEAWRKGEQLNSVVQQWVSTVDLIQADARKLNDDGEEKKRCLSGMCPDWRFRYHLSKEATKMTLIVNELHTSGNFSHVSHPLPPPSIELAPLGDFEAFASTKLAMQQIIEALNDEKIIIIGVCGMAGVGKTTLVNEVGKQLKREKLYNEVVMVTVSQNQDIPKIQGEIAEKLGMGLEHKSISVRASRLYERVKKETKILIILDDLWDRLELHEVGIPHGDVHKGCKILLTSRSVDVCNAMESDAKIEVGVLSEQDSWNLFKRKAGVVSESPTMQDLAKKVAEECGGLPLAIVTLGRTLRGKDKSFWTSVLQQLKRSIPSNIEGMDSKVYSSLMISYDSLENEEIKLCFLFCCLFPEDYNININLLIRYGMGEGFIKEVDSLEEAEDRVYTMLDKLKSCHLLLGGDYKGHVKLHDVVRDFAVSIASKERHGFLVKSGIQIKALRRENLGRRKRISMMNSGITSFDDDWPKTQYLLTLLLQDNMCLKTMPEIFFEGMEALVVLDLSRTNISSLPPSLPCLVNLRTMCLNACRQLKDVSMLGRLKRLEILSLQASGICELTKEIGRLRNLVFLDLSYTRDLKRVEPNVIKKLSRLEALYLLDSFDGWEVEEIRDGSIASFAELHSLAFLSQLRIEIKNEGCLLKDFSPNWRNLTSFHIFLGDFGYPRPIPGCVYDFKNLMDCQKIMEVGSITKPLSHLGNVLIEKTERLDFASCKIDGASTLKEFFVQPSSSEFLRELRWLSIYNCQELVTIFPPDMLIRVSNLELLGVHTNRKVQVVFDSVGLAQTQPLLSRLRFLSLCNLPNLTSVWKGPIFHGSFQNVELVKIDFCDGLRILFPSFVARSLQKLQELSVWSCKGFEKLISDEDGEEIIAEETASPKLRQHEKNPSHLTFQNLRKLNIHDNNGLKFLFTLSLAQGLQHLEVLMLWNCRQMEEIVSVENNIIIYNSLFSKLTTLDLFNLPKLMSFHHVKVSLSLPSLSLIKVDLCPILKILPLGLQSAPKLEKIRGEKEWFDQLVWLENDVESRLCSLFEKFERYEASEEYLTGSSEEEEEEEGEEGFPEEEEEVEDEGSTEEEDEAII